MTCTITGTVIGPSGDPLPNAVFEFNPSPSSAGSYSGMGLMPERTTETSSSGGAVNFTMVPGTYTCVEKTTNSRFKFVVPDLTSAAFSDCIDAATFTLVPSLVADVYAARDAAAASAAAIAPTNYVTTDTTQSITGAKTFSTGTFLVGDGIFTLRNTADGTKRLVFNLAGFTTGTTRTITWPDVSDTAAVLGAAQTWTGQQTFSAANGTFGQGTSGGTVSIAAGVTSSGNTKAVFIGPSGASGSITNVVIGPSTSGATGTITLNIPMKDPSYTVATLPTGSAGLRAFVSNSTVTASGNFGAIVAGGGANIVPVYHDGTNWRIG